MALKSEELGALLAQLTPETLESLTLGEAIDFEDAAGMEITALENRAGKLPMRAALALVWILGRRNDPALTLADCRKLRLADIAIERPAGATPDPN